MGEAKINLEVAVGIAVGVSRASRVSRGIIVGVGKVVGDETGIGVERGAAVGVTAFRLQDVKTNKMTTTHIIYFIFPPCWSDNTTL